MRRFNQDTHQPRSNLIVEDKIDAAFRRVKPNSVGFHVWKLENDRIEMVPGDQCGIFHDRDTYIVYAASLPESAVTPKTVSREVKPTQLLSRYVHFWLGAATTPERSGAVAYKVIELDNHLGNLAVQYRESQSHESDRFLSYFREGRIILSDQHADPIRLFVVYGKLSAACVQQPVAWSSFSSRHTVLLQTQRHIFVWLGRSCGQTERRLALQVARRIRQLFAATATICAVDDGYEQSLAPEAKADWNQYLNFGARHVLAALDFGALKLGGGSQSGAASAVRLYKCGLVDGKYRIEERKTGQLQQADLDDSRAAFIVDCVAGGGGGVWIWLGRGCGRKDKAEAMRNARGFVKKKQYDPCTPVVRVVDTHEPPEFQALFPHWRPTQPTSSPGSGSNGVQLFTSGKLTAQVLADRPRLAATLQLCDDGSGPFVIYKVHKGALLDVTGATSAAGLRPLFAGDCFVLHYRLVNPTPSNLSSPASHLQRRLRHFIYLWIGAQSPADTRTAASTLAAQLSAQLHSPSASVAQIRVHQSHEPAQLLQAFGGRLAIFAGSSDDYDSSGGARHLPATFLLKVRGTAAHSTRTVQVLAKAARITSRDCLVLATSAGAVWVWCGAGSTGDAREMAKAVGAATTETAAATGEYVLALEGSEPEAFWRCLPDQLESKLRMAHAVEELEGGADDAGAGAQATAAVAALYSVDGGGGEAERGATVRFRQIVGYTQADLLPEDVLLLDARSMVYVWLGELCLPSERAACWHIAQQFLAAGVAGRSKEVAVAVIQQAGEPITFVGFFEEWNAQLWETHQTIDDQRASLDGKSGAGFASLRTNGQSAVATGQPVSQRVPITAAEAEFNRFAKYPLQMLRADADQLPQLVDPQHKEMHLTHDDFVAVFAMPVVAFEALPAWRKQELKKRNKLF